VGGVTSFGRMCKDVRVCLPVSARVLGTECLCGIFRCVSKTAC
jgi:hypothetical protein